MRRRVRHRRARGIDRVRDRRGKNAFRRACLPGTDSRSRERGQSATRLGFVRRGAPGGAMWKRGASPSSSSNDISLAVEADGNILAVDNDEHSMLTGHSGEAGPMVRGLEAAEGVDGDWREAPGWSAG